ncbi:folylpolyglutamate synthase, mitochondrial-like isoform X2 [Amphiura filiformis]|uniref:folylpolyglutamate synthase, mitochondrial-like isoform X2 n=1 Tax=Amphiura filiformis TaxID=82378 RepID=UPI003B217E51
MLRSVFRTRSLPNVNHPRYSLFLCIGSVFHLQNIINMRDLQTIRLMNGIPSRAPQSTSAEKVVKSYEEAVRQLNTLQTNAAVLERIRLEQGRRVKNNLPTVIEFAKRIGLTLDKLDKLSIIHVSGTKGKGSVCAFCESILKANGVKTGFYTSPHLVEVRERIRINGKPLPKDLFTHHFFTVFNRLEASKPDDGVDAMPGYFRFLTLMAYHVFLEEKVDVAIMEVGIGGTYDCTNIHRCPTVVGISSLGIDHTSLLGDTIKEIAWQKAGICKPDRPAFSVQQPEDGLEVIHETAKERKVSLIQRCPSLSSYGFKDQPIEVGLAGVHQHINASLALQLCKTWMEEKHKDIIFESISGEPSLKKAKLTNGDEAHDASVSCDMTMAQPFVLPDSFIKGLKNCYWPGRNQTFSRDRVTYYVDGAHTPRSMKACQKWFEESAQLEAAKIDGPVARILIFNSTGDRDETPLLEVLMASHFDGAVFCPNIASVYAAQNSADQTNYNTTSSKQMMRCERNLATFDKILKESTSQAAADKVTETDNEISHSSKSAPVYTSTPHTGVSASRTQLTHQTSSLHTSTVKPDTKLVVMCCIQDAIQWAACCKDSQLGSPSLEDPIPPDASRAAKHIQVLVCGSLHLVGGVIKILDPNLAVTKL